MRLFRDFGITQIYFDPRTGEYAAVSNEPKKVLFRDAAGELRWVSARVR